MIGMEFLSKMINNKLEEGVWKVVKVNRNGPSSSHMFFANDLIFFAEASYIYIYKGSG